MQRDIEYWQTEDDVIVVEPKTIKGRTTMVEEFPIYSRAKQYRAYLGNNGSVIWEFPSHCSALHSFFLSNRCHAISVEP